MKRTAHIRARLGWMMLVVGLTLPGAGAWAGGMEVGDNGAVAMGRGGAFVAKADNPAAINYNPAGFAKLRGYQVAVSANAINSKILFQRTGTTVDGKVDATRTPYPLVENQNPWFVVPMHFMLTSDFGLSKRLTFAAGIYGPSALGGEFPQSMQVGSEDVPAPQRFQASKTTGLILFPSIAMGYRLHEKLDLGLSFQWAMSKVQNTTLATVAAACETPEDPSCDVTIDLEVEDMFAPTGSLGALYRPVREFELGALVRFPFHSEMVGQANVQFGPNVNKLGDSMRNALLDPVDPTVTVTNDYPLMIRLGGRYIFYRDGDDELADIEANITFENWSNASSRTVTIQASSLGAPLKPMDMDAKLRDTFGFRLGGSYNIRLTNSLSFTLRSGAFAESQTTEVSDTSLGNIGPRRIGLTAGLGLRWGGISMDVAYAHLFIPDRIVERSTVRATDFGSDLPGPVVGNGIYSARLDALYLQLTGTYGAPSPTPRRYEEEPEVEQPTEPDEQEPANTLTDQDNGSSKSSPNNELLLEENDDDDNTLRYEPDGAVEEKPSQRTKIKPIPGSSLVFSLEEAGISSTTVEKRSSSSRTIRKEGNTSSRTIRQHIKKRARRHGRVKKGYRRLRTKYRKGQCLKKSITGRCLKRAR